jgi:hypothetical protein
MLCRWSRGRPYACLALPCPARPIGPWSRRTGAPKASATRRDRDPWSTLGRHDAGSPCHSTTRNDDLRNVDRTAQQIDAAATQAGRLPHAQAAVGAEQHQGSVARADGVGQAGDLGRVQELHLLPLGDRAGGATQARVVLRRLESAGGLLQ